MLYTDVKYANMIGPYLRNFKRKSDYLWNFSCPICGDSKTNKSKARGYIYRAKTGLFVKCHNCQYSTNLGNLVKHLDENLYKEYVLENYRESGVPRSPHKDQDVAIPQIFKPDIEEKVFDAILDPLQRLDRLPLEHPAVEYVIKRKIPLKKWELLYFCPKFKKYVNSLIPNKLSSGEDHPRLIIPYFTSHGKIFAFQGRAFGKEEPKYLTIKLDEDAERIYGLDRLQYTKRIYIVEGPLDSLFLPNAIAVSGSSFNSPSIEALRTNATVVFDREPRSREITKIINRMILAGYSVALLPETMHGKDINDYVQNGWSIKEIKQAIDDHTYSGLRAQLEFDKWKRCDVHATKYMINEHHQHGENANE